MSEAIPPDAKSVRVFAKCATSSTEPGQELAQAHSEMDIPEERPFWANKLDELREQARTRLNKFLEGAGVSAVGKIETVVQYSVQTIAESYKDETRGEDDSYHRRNRA